MKIIPAIDLLNGECVRLWQGDYGKSETYSQDPVEMARRWVKEGADRLHIVDLSGAKAGHPVHLEVVRRIVEAIPAEVDLGGGLRTRADVEAVFAAGVHYAILGTVAIRHPELVEELVQAYPGRIIVGLDARGEKLAGQGWLDQTETTIAQVLEHFNRLPLAGIIYTDISRDGTLEGVNVPGIHAVCRATPLPVIAAGGVSTINDITALAQLRQPNLYGVIVGKAIYAGTLDLRAALQLT